MISECLFLQLTASMTGKFLYLVRNFITTYHHKINLKKNRENLHSLYKKCGYNKINTYQFSFFFFYRYRDTDWFVRVGDNFMASRDPSEQTFQVKQSWFFNLSCLLTGFGLDWWSLYWLMRCETANLIWIWSNFPWETSQAKRILKERMNQCTQ